MTRLTLAAALLWIAGCVTSLPPPRFPPIRIVDATEEMSEALHGQCIYQGVFSSGTPLEAALFAEAIGADVIMPISQRSTRSVSTDRSVSGNIETITTHTSWSESAELVAFTCGPAWGAGF